MWILDWIFELFMSLFFSGKLKEIEHMSDEDIMIMMEIMSED